MNIAIIVYALDIFVQLVNLDNFSLTTQISRRELNDVSTQLILTKDNFDFAIPYG